MIKIKNGIRRVTEKERSNYNLLCEKILEKRYPFYPCDRVPTYYVDGCYRCGLHVPKRFKSTK